MSSPGLRLALRPLADDAFLAYAIPVVDWQSDSGGGGVAHGAGDFRRTNRLLNELARARGDGETFPEALVHDGVSLWQFLPSWLWPQFHWAAELVDTVLPVLEEVQPSIVRLEASSGPGSGIWLRVVPAIAETLGIPVELVPEAHSLRTFFHVVRSFGVRTRVAARWRRLRRSLGRRAPRAAARSEYGRRLLLVTLGGRHWVPKPGANGFYDEQMYPLLEPLHDAGWNDLVVLDVQDSGPAELAGRSRQGLRWRAFGEHLPAVRSPVAQRAMSLLGDISFRRAFSYRGVSLVVALEHELRSAFDALVPMIAAELAAAGAVLDAERPEAVLVTYETGPRGRAIVIEAARRGIPTIGLMHGMIFDNHYDYMHDPVTTEPLRNPLGFAVPTRTCVWGSFWQDVLARSGSYPNEAIVVTGNWRYDELLQNLPTARSARRLLGLPPEGTLVAILSGGRRVAEFLDAALAAVAATPGIRPIVKLHAIDDAELARQALKRAGFSADSLVEGRFAETLLAADAVVSQVSTAVGEAAFLGKPVIVVDVGDVGGWGRDLRTVEALLYVSCLEDVAPALSAVLGDAAVQARLAEGRERLVAEWFGGRMPAAAARVARVVSELVVQRSMR